MSCQPKKRSYIFEIKRQLRARYWPLIPTIGKICPNTVYFLAAFPAFIVIKIEISIGYKIG
jgi:hypothetical protein